MTDRADELINAYIQLDSWVTAESKRFEEHIRPHKTKMDELKAKLLDLINNSGGESIKTQYGTAYKSSVMRAKIENRDTYLDWALDNWDIGNAMLQLAAPQIDAIKDYMQANGGHLPPGVTTDTITRLNIRRG